MEEQFNLIYIFFQVNFSSVLNYKKLCAVILFVFVLWNNCIKKYLLVSWLLLLKCELWLLGPCFSQTITDNLTKSSKYTKWYIVIVYFFFRKPDHSDNVDCRYYRVQFFCSGSMRQFRISHFHSNCCKPGKIDVIMI